MKVLVADDSKMMRVVIRRTLELLGTTEIGEAEDGQQAIDLFQQEIFDLVITDWNMPKKNGIDVVRAIRESGSKIPIIMVTTEAERERVVEAIQAGITDYLAKPFSNDVLRDKLAKHGCELAC